MTNHKNIPKLRFTEFEGEWEKQRLGNFFVERNELANQDYPLYSLTIEHGIIAKSERYERSFLVNDLTDAYKIMHKDDFAFNPMNLRFGALARHKEDKKVAVSKYYNIFHCNNYGNSIFFEIYLTSYDLIQYYNKMSSGSLTEKKRVHYLEFIEFRRNLPTLPEQQKIASLFTAIDQKISQLKQKTNLLEQYKKWVMQRIFNQDIRFKDDNVREFPNWEKSKFGNIYSFKVTNSFSRDNLNYEDGYVKNIHYGDIHTKFKTLFDLTKEEVPFINPDISINKISSDNYCKTNDIVFADASEDLADVGKSIELVNLNNEKVLAGLHTILARPDMTKIASGFGGYLMKSIDVRKQIMKIAQGSKITSISSTRLCDIELNIPCPAEQSKIADSLSAIDDKINHTHKQIEKAEVWKKGLLQQMFV